MQRQQGGHQVGGLRQGLAPLASLRGKSRMRNHQRNMRNFIKKWHAVLAPPVVLGQQKAMVSAEDQRGVRPHGVAVHVVEQSAKVLVAHTEQGRIVGPHFLHLERSFLAALVARPIQYWAGIARGVGLAKTRRRGKGLMRVEALEMQHPVVGVAVGIQKVKASFESARAAKISLFFHVLPVHHGLQAAIVRAFGLLHGVVHLPETLQGRLHHGLPFVPLLAPDKFPRRIAVVVSGPAILPVVVMVRDQVRIRTPGAQQFREGLVKGLQRAPATV